MRPINLLPSRYRPARASGERPGIGYAAIGVLAVLLIMVVAYVVTNNQIDDAKKKTADAQAQQAAAEAKIGQLQAYGDFANLKDQRENAVRSVAEGRFDYERLMREMALVMPHNTYLTAFSAAAGSSTATTGTTAAAGGPSVSITACAPSHQAVATAVVRLRQLHNISDVNLKSSQKGTGTSGSSSSTSSSSNTGCAVTWTADLAFNAETPTATNQPVPARLGGGQ